MGKDGTPETGDDQIDAEYLKIWALLHCAGEPAEKAVTFYGIL